MTFDIGSIDTVAASDKGREIELYNPGNRDPLGIFIKIVGKDSSELQEEVRKNRNEMIRLRRTQTPEEQDEAEIRYLAVATKSWRSLDPADPTGTINFLGEQLKCTKENAIKVYAGRKWIRDQVDVAVADIARFLAP